MITKQQILKYAANKTVTNYKQSPITNHVFPKRSAKTTDKTEKPKIPSTLGKHTVRYNEFCRKKVILNFLYNIDLRHP